MEQEKDRFGYWFIRGLGSCSRHLLIHLKVDFDDVIYYSGPDWMQAKNNFSEEVGECLLPNIPWYKHDGVVLTQHSSILRKIAQVHKPEYLGTTTQD